MTRPSFVCNSDYSFILVFSEPRDEHVLHMRISVDPFPLHSGKISVFLALLADGFFDKSCGHVATRPSLARKSRSVAPFSSFQILACVVNFVRFESPFNQFFQKECLCFVLFRRSRPSAHALDRPLVPMRSAMKGKKKFASGREGGAQVR